MADRLEFLKAKELKEKREDLSNQYFYLQSDKRYQNLTAHVRGLDEIYLVLQLNYCQDIHDSLKDDFPLTLQHRPKKELENEEEKKEEDYARRGRSEEECYHSDSESIVSARCNLDIYPHESRILHRMVHYANDIDANPKERVYSNLNGYSNLIRIVEYPDLLKLLNDLPNFEPKYELFFKSLLSEREVESRKKEIITLVIMLSLFVDTSPLPSQI